MTFSQTLLSQTKRMIPFATEDPACTLSFVERFLTAPISDLASRPGKNLRGEFMQACFTVACHKKNCSAKDRELFQSVQEVVDLLHVASLIIDDVEDSSAVRRGGPTLHATYGVPLAINAGSWLYFYALTKLMELDLVPQTKERLNAACVLALNRGHIGQALDLGAADAYFRQEDAMGLCLLTHRLKTGALMSLAGQAASLLLQADEPTTHAFARFGEKVGMALQQLDDINDVFFASHHEEKKIADFLTKRPSWVVACCAQSLSHDLYQRFSDLVTRLPESQEDLFKFLAEHDMQRLSFARTRTFLDSAFAELCSCFPTDTGLFVTLENFCTRLLDAYQ